MAPRASYRHRMPHAVSYKVDAEQAAKLVELVFEKIQESFVEKNEKFEAKEARQLLTEPPEKPHFPVLILAVAITADVLDLLDFTGVGIIVAMFTGAVSCIILTVWTWNKLSGGWWKKPMIRWLWGLVFCTSIVEIAPFLQLVPAETIFVLMAFYREKKIVQLFDHALELIHESGIGEFV